MAAVHRRIHASILGFNGGNVQQSRIFVRVNGATHGTWNDTQWPYQTYTTKRYASWASEFFNSSRRARRRNAYFGVLFYIRMRMILLVDVSPTFSSWICCSSCLVSVVCVVVFFYFLFINLYTQMSPCNCPSPPPPPCSFPWWCEIVKTRRYFQRLA